VRATDILIGAVTDRSASVSDQSQRQSVHRGRLTVNRKEIHHLPTVSAVTCAFSERRWPDLVAALKSLRAQRYPPDEMILVVDNNPALLARARLAFPDLVVVANAHRRGASGARNTGGALAGGDVIAFLDDDAQASPTWLWHLLRPFEEARVAGVGGQALPLWPTRRPRWFPGEFDWVIGCSYVGLPLARGPVRNLIGTNMAVRRDLMVAVGGFREGFGNVVDEEGEHPRTTRLSTGEETDFCIRVTLADPDSKWLYEPAATVYHRVPPERATFHFFVTRCWIEGKGKATLTELLGRSSALEAERAYVRKVLPRGIRDGLAQAISKRDWAGIGRAGAIAIGLGVTGYSYVVHRAMSCLSRSRHRGRPSTIG
jgi:glycosyltransferase involved in cell wall biosynthesis